MQIGRIIDNLPISKVVALVDYAEFLNARNSERREDAQIDTEPVPAKNKPGKRKNLEPHDTIVGDPESLIDITWEKEWLEDNGLSEGPSKKKP